MPQRKTCYQCTVLMRLDQKSRTEMLLRIVVEQTFANFITSAWVHQQWTCRLVILTFTLEKETTGL